MSKYQFEENRLLAYIDEELEEIFKRHRVIVAGGAITSLFCNREFADIDVYVRDEESLVGLLTDLFDIATVHAHTNKATLFQRSGDIHIQVIHFQYFSDVQSIFDTFDYTVCMGAYDFDADEFVLHDDFLRHNAQRLLQFNKGTTYPMVSMLRVQKYQKKGYTISKPEFLRVVMSCMALTINSYDELKEHLGGMYGINYDKLFEKCDGTFSLDAAIDAVANLSLDEDYFKSPVPLEYHDIEDILDNVTSTRPKYVEIGGEWYKILPNGALKQREVKPNRAEVIDGDLFVRGTRFYKFVNKVDGKYFSFYDKKFEYHVGERVVAKGGLILVGKPRLYLNHFAEINKSTYRDNTGAVLIECAVEPADWIVKDGHAVQVSACTMLREVPVAEYEKYLK